MNNIKNFRLALSEFHKKYLFDLKFRKKGNTLLREWGATTQIINFQKSRSEALYYTNIGVSFHEIADFNSIERRVDKVEQCSLTGIYTRLSNLDKRAIDWPEVLGSHDATLFEKILLDFIPNLNALQSVADYIGHKWRLGRESNEISIISLYILGRYEDAMGAISSLCRILEDHPMKPTPKKIVEKYGLTKLQGYL
ncbi:uncharacterized protein DUF4304 [Alteromonadaceae bacterium 2753L.S.0a.02]|nr:uncharacterized protein DUF4304 [Alteromonadaceae bacterium 2753L.S.0a.02]